MGRDSEDVVICDPKYFSKAAILQFPQKKSRPGWRREGGVQEKIYEDIWMISRGMRSLVNKKKTQAYSSSVGRLGKFEGTK